MSDTDRIAELEATIAKMAAQIAELQAATVDRVVKVDPEKRIVMGWAYVAKKRDGTQVIDWSGDVVEDFGHVEDRAYDFVEKSRVGNLNHAGAPVATLVESAIFTPEKVEKMGLSPGALPTGWWAGFRVHDDTVWNDVRSGKLRMFSIEGSGVRNPRGLIVPGA